MNVKYSNLLFICDIYKSILYIYYIFIYILYYLYNTKNFYKLCSVIHICIYIYLINFASFLFQTSTLQILNSTTNDKLWKSNASTKIHMWVHLYIYFLHLHTYVYHIHILIAYPCKNTPTHLELYLRTYKLI